MARLDFLDRIERLIRVNIPASEAQSLDLRRMAEHCVVTAEGMGLTTERAIAAFVLHMVRINPEFYRQSTMASLLMDTSVDESTRMEQLLTNPDESAWEEAAVMCDPMRYWQPFRVPAPTPDPDPDPYP
jgi:hypothetical protein